MKILLVADFAPPVRGGMEFHVDTLATELAARGHDVHLATLTPNAAASSPDVTVHVVRSAARLLPHESPERPFHPPLPEPQARRSLARIIRDVEPDVIHSHNWLGVSLPKSRAIPVVLTAHDYGYICQLRTLLQPSLEVCSGPAPRKCFDCARQVLGSATAALMTPGTQYGRRLLRPTKLIAVSSAVAHALGPYFEDPIDVVPNFVGAEPPHEALPELIPSGDFVLYAGDPGPHKGVPDLIDIWSGPDAPEVPLVIATTRPATLPSHPNIHGVSLSRGQMAAAWRAATVAVVPSRWADPCPTVALEAMRAGTPVVGTAIGGMLDMIRDGVDGLLAPPADQPALSAQIKRLLADPALRRELGASAQHRAIQFSATRVVEEIIAVYEGVRAK